MAVWSKLEIRAVVRFLFAKGTKCSVTYREILENYGEHAMSMTQVYQWCSWFKDGRTSLQDEPRSGRPNTANNDWNIARVDELIKVDRRVKLKEISLKLEIPKTNVYEIVHDTLKIGYRKVPARWVPKMLSDEHNRQRVEISQILLHRRCQQEVENDGEHAMSRTQVYQWCSWFKDGRTSLQDEPANNDWNIARVDELIKVDRRVKLKKISLKLDIPKTDVYEIVHDKLGYRKVSARWVPKMLSDEHKRQRVEISQILLQRCQQEGDETVDVGPGGDHRARNKLLEHLIAGDKTWLRLSTQNATQ
ncbi:histone-lysine N-methyltransferase SETMAR [Plakobranchus ocellatus]|uniref:Histone-lysine N-methyltransferase SETMAR n=1 Tax=Plakobranchus ocellatus TaxID=259542 RepID=A0AAV4CV32_9GAST|nr:histone-lysine N-methyltransferase SETMAR [Plakobranchus ocellatus]